MLKSIRSRAIVGLIAAVLTCGCSGSTGYRSNVSAVEATKRLKVGSSPAEVEAVMGKAKSIRKHPQFSGLEIWDYSDKDFATFDGNKLIGLTLDDKLVIEDKSEAKDD